MENMNNNTKRVETQNSLMQTISIEDMLHAVLKKWYWVVISVVVFLAIGGLYLMQKAPVYQRQASVLIKDVRKGSAANELAAFSG